jgi:predicted amidophosphoribosyltransferase
MNRNKRSLMLGCTLDATDAGLMRAGRIYAFGPYIPRSMQEHWDSSWTRMVLQVKRNNPWVVMRVGELLAAHLDCWLEKAGRYVVTCVPHARKPRSMSVGRAWCASERLASAVHCHLGNRTTVTLGELFIQAQPKTKPQHRCDSIAERVSNVRGCYAVKSGIYLSGMTVVLIDDVVTSGSTMHECEAALMKAGADGVIGMAMAQTIRTGRMRAKKHRRSAVTC